MTQKANLFKGKAKKKSIPPNRHGKVPVTRKGFYFSNLIEIPKLKLSSKYSVDTTKTN